MAKVLSFKSPSKVHTKSLSFGIIVGSMLGIFSLGLIGIIFWGLSTSLKAENHITDFIGFELKNYIEAFNHLEVMCDSGNRVDFMELTFNSIMYSAGCALIRTFTTCTVAYLCAKYDNWFSRLVHYVVIVTIALPIVGNTASLLNIAKEIKIFDTLWGQIIMKLGFNNVYYLIFFSAFKKIPDAYKEAASMDGAGHFNIYFRIIFPLVKTLFITIFLLNFILFWNDYQGPLLFLPNHPTLAVSLFKNFIENSTYAGLPNIQCASGVLIFIPIFIIFLIFRNKIMGNFEGGIK